MLLTELELKIDLKIWFVFWERQGVLVNLMSVGHNVSADLPNVIV